MKEEDEEDFNDPFGEGDGDDEDPGDLTLVAVPINFEYEGTEQKALIIPVSGAGGGFHFHVVKGTRYKHLYCGALFMREDEWAYYGNSFHGMARYFGEYLMAWYQ